MPERAADLHPRSIAWSLPVEAATDDAGRA